MRISSWKFISRNFTPFITIIMGVVVIILSQLSIISDNIVNSTILGLLVLLATSELVDKRASLESIDNRLEEISLDISEVTHGVKAIKFNNNKDLLEYLTSRTLASAICIDQASIDYRRTSSNLAREEYNIARDTIIKSDKLKYRYLGVLYEARRMEIARTYALDKRYENFFAAYYPKPSTEFPLMNFVIFDKKEVLARYPYEQGQDEGYIVIQSVHVANLFLGYFDSLWANAQKINSEDDIIKISK